MQQVAPRSYIVNVGGREYRRNRKFHRATEEQVQEEPCTMEQSTAGTPEPGAELTKAPQLLPISEETGPRTQKEPDKTELGQTRTRIVRPPDRYRDFFFPRNFYS